MTEQASDHVDDKTAGRAESAQVRQLADETTPTLHEVLTRGITKALSDLGVTLQGCKPELLTGHIIQELLAAGMHPGPPRRREPHHDEPQWRVGVEVPMRLPEDVRFELLTLLTDTATDWAEQARDTGDDWDVNAYGCKASVDAPDHFHDPIADERDAAVRDSEHLRSRLTQVVTELLRGGTTYRDRCRSAFAALVATDELCGHGWPRALVDCPTCDAARCACRGEACVGERATCQAFGPDEENEAALPSSASLVEESR